MFLTDIKASYASSSRKYVDGSSLVHRYTISTSYTRLSTTSGIDASTCSVWRCSLVGKLVRKLIIAVRIVPSSISNWWWVRYYTVHVAA